LFISLKAEKDWQGKIIFDFPRHQKYLHLPLDYPRINQFPEWFTVEAQKTYQIKSSYIKERMKILDEELLKGWETTIKAGDEVRIIVQLLE
jgi:hypothetical protein